MSNRPSVRAAAALAALVVVPLLGGCSGGGSDPEPTSTSSGAASATESAVPASATLEGREPALKHLRITACPSGEGDLEATGTIRNRGKDAADYVVTVSWLDEGGSVLESVETTVEDVKPATNAPWKASATLDERAGSCTTTLARGTLP